MTESTDHPDPKEATEAKLCAYLEGELAPGDRAEIERHLTANPQHKQLLAELAKTREWVRAIPRVRAPADFAESFQSTVERQMLLDETAAARPAQRWQQWLPLAAVVLLVAGIGIVVTVMLSPSWRRSPIASRGDGFSSSTVPAEVPSTEPAAIAPPAPMPAPMPTPMPDALAKVMPADPAPAVPASRGGFAPGAAVDAAITDDGSKGKDQTAVATRRARTDAASSDLLAAAPTAWAPPVTGFAFPADDRTLYVVVRTATPAPTLSKAQAFFEHQHVAVQIPGLGNGAMLAYGDREPPRLNGAAINNAQPATALQLNRQQAINQARNLLPQNAPSQTQPATMPVDNAVPAIAGRGLKPGQIDDLAAALAEDVNAGDVRIMIPDHGRYTNALAVMPIAKGRSILVVVPELDKPGVDKANIVEVAPDGTVGLPMLDRITAAGVLPVALSEQIAVQYQQAHVFDHLAKVDVTVLPVDAPAPTTMPGMRPTSGPIGGSTDKGYTVVVVTEVPGR
jgi:hypothetical protein